MLLYLPHVPNDWCKNASKGNDWYVDTNGTLFLVLKECGMAPDVPSARMLHDIVDLIMERRTPRWVRTFWSNQVSKRDAEIQRLQGRVAVLSTALRDVQACASVTVFDEPPVAPYIS